MNSSAFTPIQAGQVGPPRGVSSCLTHQPPISVWPSFLVGAQFESPGEEIHVFSLDSGQQP